MRRYLLGFCTAGLLIPALAGAATMRPAVARHLLAAESDLRARDYPAALAQVDAAQAVGQLSADEALAVAQLRGSAAGGEGNYRLAATSYETVLGTGNEPAPLRLALIQSIAGFYASAGDNPQTVVWVNRYIAAGGQDGQVRALAAQADYEQGNDAAALRDARRDIAAGTAPVAELQLAASAAKKTGDNQTYFELLRRLLAVSPSPAEWNEAITLVQAAANFPDGLTLDVDRLRLATGTLTGADAYEDYAERAILVGQPAEAKRVLDAGFASGTLTAQTDGGHAGRLLSLADAQAARPQPASVPTASALDTAIASGRGFENVPGYSQGDFNNSLAALARLWKIVTDRPQN